MELYPDVTDAVPAHLAAKYETHAARYWDKFYQRNEDRFYKDRHYLHREFPQLMESGPKTLLEVGCGAGNTCYPLLETFPELRVFCCDFSSRAVEIVKAHHDYASLAGPSGGTKAVTATLSSTTAAARTGGSSGSSSSSSAMGVGSSHSSHRDERRADVAAFNGGPGDLTSAPFNGTAAGDVANATVTATAAATTDAGSSSSAPSPSPGRLVAFVADIADPAVSDVFMQRLPAAGVDFVTMVFVLSAIAPQRMPQAIASCVRCLRPGGRLLFRDYSSGDLAQDRLSRGVSRCLGERFYLRGDGTRCYYFDKEELLPLFGACGLRCEDVRMHERQRENRKRNIVMHRRWLQAVFVKDVDGGPQSEHHGNGVSSVSHIPQQQQQHSQLPQAAGRPALRVDAAGAAPDAVPPAGLSMSGTWLTGAAGRLVTSSRSMLPGAPSPRSQLPDSLDAADVLAAELVSCVPPEGGTCSNSHRLTVMELEAQLEAEFFAEVQRDSLEVAEEAAAAAGLGGLRLAGLEEDQPAAPSPSASAAAPSGSHEAACSHTAASHDATQEVRRSGQLALGAHDHFAPQRDSGPVPGGTQQSLAGQQLGQQQQRQQQVGQEAASSSADPFAGLHEWDVEPGSGVLGGELGSLFAVQVDEEMHDEVVAVTPDVHFIIRCLSREHRNTNSNTGLMFWESAPLLARLLAAAGPSVLHNAACLELGAGGSGVCAMAAARFGARRVVASDGSAAALSLLSANLRRNAPRFVAERVRSEQLVWGDVAAEAAAAADCRSAECEQTQYGLGLTAAHSRRQATKGRYDLLFGADTLYSMECVRQLFAAARWLVRVDVDRGDSGAAKGHPATGAGDDCSNSSLDAYFSSPHAPPAASRTDQHLWIDGGALCKTMSAGGVSRDSFDGFLRRDRTGRLLLVFYVRQVSERDILAAAEACGWRRDDAAWSAGGDGWLATAVAEVGLPPGGPCQVLLLRPTVG